MWKQCERRLARVSRPSLGKGCLLYFAGSFIGLTGLGFIDETLLTEPMEHPGAIVAAMVSGIAALVALSMFLAWRRRRAQQPPR